MKKPIIGIFVMQQFDTMAYNLKWQYMDSVESLGAVPMLIPASTHTDMKRIAEVIDGLLLPGGPDLSPLFYGEEPIEQVTASCRKNDISEMELLREVRKLGKPVLGICRGMQLINVCFGGSLWQDLPKQTDAYVCHHQDNRLRGETTHTVSIDAGSRLHQVMGMTETLVNSYHHQAVREPAPGFKVTARAKDGIVEAIESDDGILAVQWHPEDLYAEHEEHKALFQALVDAAREQANA